MNPYDPQMFFSQLNGGANAVMDARLVVSSAHFWARAFFRLMGTVLQQRRCVRQVQQLVGLMRPRK